MKFWLTLLLVGYSSIALALTRSFDLSQLGHQAGITCSDQTMSSDVFIATPEAKYISEAYLDLKLQYSSYLIAPSHVKIKINDRPVDFINLKSGARDLNHLNKKITIDSQLFTDSFIKLSFDFYLNVKGEKCLGGALLDGLVHIKPETNFTYKLKTHPLEIGDYLASLPAKVMINVKALKLNESEFRHLFLLTQLLSSMGREYQIVNSNQLTEINFINEAEQLSLIDHELKKSSSLKKDYSPISSDSIDVFRVIDQVGLVVRRDLLSDFASMLNQAYMLLNQKHVSPKAFDTKASYRSQLYFDEFKLKPQGRRTADGQEWNLLLDRLSDGKIPSKLKLSLTTTPTPGDGKNFLNVYQDGNLLETIELDNSGLPQRHEIELVNIAQSQTTKILLRTLRSEAQEGCRGGGAFFDSTILPDTVIEFTTNQESKIQYFWQLLPYIGAAQSVYIQESFLADFRFIFSHMNALFNSIRLNPSAIEFKFFDQTLESVNQNGFIMFSQNDFVSQLKAPITKKEHYEFFNNVAQTKFKFNDLRNIALMQLAQINNFTGLSYHFTSNSFPHHGRFVSFDQSNVVVLESTRDLVRFDYVKERELPSTFSEEQEIISFLKKYKMALFAIGWIILTFIFLRLRLKLK